MTIVQMCEVADVSRAGWYRRSDEPTKSERDIELRDAIQKKIDFRAANGKEYKLRTDKKLPTLIVRYVPELYLVPYRVLALEVGI